MYSRIILLIITCISINLNAQHINSENIKTHISYLASDKLEGRAPGTKGEKLAIKYIKKQFKSFKLKGKGEKNFGQTFDYSITANPHDANPSSSGPKKGTNVIAFLDNQANSTIVIGAHFDHLGKGHNISALDTDKNAIHNGADDNASGTAGVIELARYLTTNNLKENYNYLFICFSAEEDGLVGSKYFSNHPTVSLSSINCMINMDMIGRLDPKTRKLLVYGVGTSPDFAGVIDTTEKRFVFVIDSSGVGPTDHTSFYLKDIPVLSFFTGQHSDYHKASDDVEKINFDGEVKVLEYIISVINKLDKKPKLKFSATKQKTQEKMSFKVTLGIMPDYSYTDPGLRVDAVTEGRPAQKAGIQAGDIIVELGEKPVKDIYEYMDRLGSFSKGQKTTAKVKRNGQLLSFEVEF